MKTDTIDTRQHILDTGYRLIVSKGFSSVGLAEILKAAGVPKGSFYYYFKSKEQFGEEIITRYFNDYLIALDAIFQPQEGSGYERLLKYWQHWIDTQSGTCADQKCLVVKLSGEVADLSDPMRLALLTGSSQVITRIAECIQEGIEDGSISIRHPQTIAELLYQMWLGASLMSKLQQNAEALQRAMSSTRAILTGTSVD
jgi:TetR/AcrR family transcriptional repressor of nem operon